MRFPSAGMLSVVALTFGAVGTGCKPAPVAFPAEPAGQLEIKYPLDETLFPPEIVAPTFVWNDATEGVVGVEGAAAVRRARTPCCASRPPSRSWRPSEADWAEIKRKSTERDAEVAIVGVAAARQGRVRRDGAHPHVDGPGRRLALLSRGAAAVPRRPCRIRRASAGASARSTREERPADRAARTCRCAATATRSRDDGSVLGLDVDYGNDKGAYAVLPVAKDMVLDDEKIITWSDYRREDGEATFGLLSQVSPDGRYVISTVKDRAGVRRHARHRVLAAVLPDQGHPRRLRPRDEDVQARCRAPTTRSTCRATRRGAPTARTSSSRAPKAYHSRRGSTSRTACCSTRRTCPSSSSDKKPFRYDLYRIPFNDGKGGTAEPLEGASNNGMSNYFAEVLAGRQVDRVLQGRRTTCCCSPTASCTSSRPRAARRGGCACNTRAMNSWHSWSSNSRWLVFSSKANTPYTQLFLTHIDEEGNDTPAGAARALHVAGPRRQHPGVRQPIAADAIAKIQEQFLDAYSFLRAGMANEHTGDYTGAERAYRRGLEIEPDNAELLQRARVGRCSSRARARRRSPSYEKALAIDPKHVKSHNNLALALDRPRRARAGRGALPRVARDRARGRRSTTTSASCSSAWGMPEDAARGVPQGARTRPGVERCAHQPGLVTGAQRQATLRPRSTFAPRSRRIRRTRSRSRRWPGSWRSSGSAGAAPTAPAR